MSLLQEDIEAGASPGELQRVFKHRLKKGKHAESAHKKRDKRKDDLDVSRNISYIHQTHSPTSPPFPLI